jgi:uncharacterized protein YydD (DUF2326 family)
MFLHSLGSYDSRFKNLNFHDGMNILLTDKTTESQIGNSRNGAGKTSFVRILRYLLAGNLDPSLKSDKLIQHTFWADLELGSGTNQVSRIERPVKPQTKVRVKGTATGIDEWKFDVGQLFHLPESTTRPTVGQLVGQLVRDYFSDPLKIFPAESSWESGARIGYLLGFSPEILTKAGEVAALEKNRKALRKAISDGALGSLSLNEAELRARLAQTRQRRSRLESNLSGFRVDDQYAEHQSEADNLTHEIRDLNDEGLTLEQRRRDLELAMQEEKSTSSDEEVAKQLETMYGEIGIVLPDAVTRRFDEVSDFHTSVVRNRQMYLQSELTAVIDRLRTIQTGRTALDQRRAAVMSLLNDAMALETFRNAEREVTELDATVADLERRLELVQSVNDTGLHLRTLMAEAEASLRTEIAERENPLEQAIALFQQLGEDIYNDREVSLLIEATSKGILKVVPKIDGDASAGILGVKTFLLDIVCLVMAIKVDRAPHILVHDSLLFDSMDDRQVASCLNIGAHLAETIGFQYIVTLNSDRLASAEVEGFNRGRYVIDPILTDASENGGLFGFRFQ